MYKPANIREFVTPATHKKPTVTLINGHNQKTYSTNGTLKGKVKHPINTDELDANGLSVVEDKITFITWYTSSLAAHDILTINGIDYEIIGTPENVGERGRYSIVKLKRIEGGA